LAAQQSHAFSRRKRNLRFAAALRPHVCIRTQLATPALLLLRRAAKETSLKVLITGGAGFIGRAVARALLAKRYRVVVLDALIEQVHRDNSVSVLPAAVELVRGDIRDADSVRKALAGVDKVVHLAAEVGVGQSMYAIERYTSVNDCGTAVLFEQLQSTAVKRVVVASSMSIYGEGLYVDRNGSCYDNVERDYAAGGWEPRDAAGLPLTPIATPEHKRPSLASVYALTKYTQERLTLMLASAYGIEGCALRLFNVFGPGQALSNPYTGVLAIFAARLLNRQPPLIFEDGRQRRDFVHVEDVADAFVAALERSEAVGGAFNIGSGRNYSILEVAERLAAAMGRDELAPEVLGKARIGDIRHCFADIGLARERLGFRPRRRLEDSLAELADWVATQKAVDRVGEARRELEQRGLVA
jgi:dTDP-L-rhamnose 4-epimerase